MRRRNLLFGLLAVTTMGGARAEQSRKAYRIAIAAPAGPVGSVDPTVGQAFINELRRLGYVEGDNFLIERFSGEGRAAYFPDLAQDVVRRKPDVIISNTTFLTVDFKAATTTIPIVGIFGYHRGRHQYWERAVGQASPIVSPGGAASNKLGVLDTRRDRDTWEADMPALGRRRRFTFVGPPLNYPVNEAEYRRVFASLAQIGVDGIEATDEVENLANLKVIVELAEKYRLPALYPFAVFVKYGGLMSWSRRAGNRPQRRCDGWQNPERCQTGRHSHLPATKFVLAINLKTAKALGLTVPPELLATADEVIE